MSLDLETLTQIGMFFVTFYLLYLVLTLFAARMVAWIERRTKFER